MTMRLKNSKYNVTFNIIQLALTTILSFITRTFFIHYLGKEMLGIDGLFTNILSMLSLTELGIGAAISYSLYDPLAKSNKEKISSLMTMYKKIYEVIGILVFLIGLLIIPILPFFTKGYNFDDLNLIYLLYLISASSSYFVIYKELLLIADQRGYKVFWIRAIFISLLYMIEILILFLTSNFILYLIANTIIRFVENITINLYVGKSYSEIDFHSRKKVDEETKKQIVYNIKNLFFGKLGDYLLNGTDNIIISTIDIGLTGLYSNYLSIISIMKSVITSIFNGLISSLGNLVATETKKVQENVFNIITFASFVISGFILLELIFLFNPFINIWIGDEYLLNTWMVIIISFNFYFYSQLQAVDSIKTASGKYRVDRYIPLIQAIINIIVSVILGHYIGIGGVLLGTLISYITVGCIWKPYLVYKYVFNKKPGKYYIIQIAYLLILIILFFMLNILFSHLSFSNVIIEIITKGIAIASIYIITIIIVFHKTEEFKYLYGIVKNVIARGRKNANDSH